MKLNDIRHVGVSMDLGLFVLEKNGRTTSLSTSGLNREEIQIMRQEMHNFLNLTRLIEYSDKSPITDYNLLISSDSDDDISQLSYSVKKCPKHQSNCENEKEKEDA